MYSELFNSSDEGLVFTQAKFGSSSATSTQTATVSETYTGTGVYTYPVFVPGGAGAISSKPYSSTANSAICWEQIFTQSPDPRPRTPDWTNFICQFTAGDWKEWSAYIYAEASGTGSTPGEVWLKRDSPLIRAYYTNSSEDSLSAELPVDGYNFVGDWESYESASASTSVSGRYSAATNGWFPISRIAGSETGAMLAAVAVNMEFYNFTSFSESANYANWSAGLYTALPPGCKLSGAIRFRTDSTGESSSYPATAEYTYLYSGTATATASASSVQYDIPSGSATMTGIATVCPSTGSGSGSGMSAQRYPWSASGVRTLAQSDAYGYYGTMIPLHALHFVWTTTSTTDKSKVLLSSAVMDYVCNSGGASGLAWPKKMSDRSGFAPSATHENVWVKVTAEARPVVGANNITRFSLAMPNPLVQCENYEVKYSIKGATGSSNNPVVIPSAYGGSIITGSSITTASLGTFQNYPSSTVQASSLINKVLNSMVKTNTGYAGARLSAYWSASGVYVDYGE